MQESIFRPGRNVWQVAKAGRAAVLIDGAAFFSAVRAACLNARRSIFIAGWDMDSRTRLVGESNTANDGHALGLKDFFSELVAMRPDLRVYLLLWDYSLLYAAERELFPRLSLKWQTPDRITLCMDNAVPFGSSQHQKFVVVDDALAFSGGLDLTQRRWDTSEHKAVNPDRVDAGHHSYRPFHDVQMMVDGEAARAIAELARRRWCHAQGSTPQLEPFGDPWPQSITPHFRDVEMGIARTQPRYGDQEEVREVEALFLDAIASAERSIYIENQFLTSPLMAEALARRLKERPHLEIVAVTPQTYDSFFESQTMLKGRAQFLKTVRDAGGRRVRVMYPEVTQDGVTTDTMVHSKVMIVDDAFLRVGSANLNNRSMGVDTECDLAIEARDDTQRRAIAALRGIFLGDHCGVAGETAAQALEQKRSLVDVADSLCGNGHRLRPVEECDSGVTLMSETLSELADPRRPIRGPRIWKILRRTLAQAELAAFAPLAIACALLGLTLLWQFTPLADILTRERAAGLFASIASTGAAPLLVIAVYLLAGAVAFPVLILIFATAVTFGPVLGFVYALMGVIASAVAMYFAGNRFGSETLRRILGSRWDDIHRRLGGHGVLAVTSIRLVPIAPFTLVNLAAGAIAIPLADYIIGTLMGMLPGLVVISFLGTRAAALMSDLSAQNVIVLLLGVAAWIGIAIGAQALALHLRKSGN